MFGFLEHSENHCGLIAALDMLMPVLTIQAVAPVWVRPLIMTAAIGVPGALKAALALHGIGGTATAAVLKRKGDIESGVSHRHDLLQQLFDIVREKGEKVNFGTGEVTLESWAAM